MLKKHIGGIVWAFTYLFCTFIACVVSIEVTYANLPEDISRAQASASIQEQLNKVGLGLHYEEPRPIYVQIEERGLMYKVAVVNGD